MNTHIKRFDSKEKKRGKTKKQTSWQEEGKCTLFHTNIAYVYIKKSERKSLNIRTKIINK